MKTTALTLSFLLIFWVVPTFAQTTNEIQTIKKQLKKTNPPLAKEFADIKFIPAKTFMLQEFEGYDSLSYYQPRKVTTESFYISPFEVTNKQYREFIYYVQDSILRHLMGFEKQTNDGTTYIDWKKKLDISDIPRISANTDFDPVNAALIDLRHDSNMVNYINGRPQLVNKKLVYEYKEDNKIKTIPVVQDIDAWKKDYPYTYNEPPLINQFYFPAFDDYPVTGVSFYQAQAYCYWKTQQLNRALGADAAIKISVCLPTLYQWEAAAVTGRLPDSAKDNSMEQASINELRRYQNKPIKSNTKDGIAYDCNFFTIVDKNNYVIKNAGDDGAVFTMKVNAFKPNTYGVYNLKGNVAEWTSTNGDESYAGSKFNLPEQSSPGEKVAAKNNLDSFLLKISATKIVKGGSWKSSAFYIQPGVNQFYTPDTKDGGIGFRYVVILQKKNN
ncbi:MAG: SUMF1/EgtB/PvdO family nonheme iron enzyme [Bacteroidetes bacterium]|nr:SUMF1/EgtB/PvdO family nonheme iron enzyme [Bacteroidota bacterium]